MAGNDAIFESILDACGGFGLYQILLIFLQHNVMEMFVDQNLAAMVFVVAAPKWMCSYNKSTLNRTSAAEQFHKIHENCEVYSNCSNTGGHIEYQEDILTIVTEFDLYCDKSWVGEFLTTLQTLGSLCGALVMAQLAESFGRKPILAICYCLTAILGIVTSTVTSWRMAAVTMFVTGFTASGFWTASFVLMQEVLLPKYRMLAFIFHGWHANGFLLVFNMWFFGDWRKILFWTNCCALPIVLLFIWLICESPRYLLQHGHTESARKALLHIAKMNRHASKSQVCGDLNKLIEVKESLECDERASKRKHYSYWDLFRTPQMAAKSTVMIFSWFACSHVSYGLYFNIKSLPGNRVLNQLTVTLLNFFSNYSILLTDRCCGRKVHHQMALLAMAGSMTVVAILYFQPELPLRDPVMTFFAILGQGVNCAGWMCIYMYSAELFPTVVRPCRSLSNGAGSMAARLGGALAPSVLYLGQFLGFLPWLIWISLIMLNSILACLFLPETKNKPLPEDLPERSWSKAKKLDYADGIKKPADV